MARGSSEPAAQRAGRSSIIRWRLARNQQGELRSVALDGIHPDAAAQECGGDAVDNIQSDAGTTASQTRGENRIEYPAKVLCCYAGTIVRKYDFNIRIRWDSNYTLLRKDE